MLPDPHSLRPLSSTEFVDPPPSKKIPGVTTPPTPKKIPGYATTRSDLARKIWDILRELGRWHLAFQCKIPIIISVRIL
jgi:hypothetical protein